MWDECSLSLKQCRTGCSLLSPIAFLKFSGFPFLSVVFPTTADSLAGIFMKQCPVAPNLHCLISVIGLEPAHTCIWDTFFSLCLTTFVDREHHTLCCYFPKDLMDFCRKNNDSNHGNDVFCIIRKHFHLNSVSFSRFSMNSLNNLRPQLRPLWDFTFKLSCFENWVFLLFPVLIIRLWKKLPFFF